jgi:PAS domain S-box-containing protein
LDLTSEENFQFSIEQPQANEMAARVAAFDWGKTPLGAIDGWPLNLRTAVDICLHSRFPMRIWWGPQLINIYNDAYAVVLGDRHPTALGQSAPELWHDVWPAIYPQVEAVMKRGESTWQKRFLLKLVRDGKPEEIWLAWSYSPIRNLDGAVEGMMCVATQDTTHILAYQERQGFAQQREQLLRSLEAERANLAEVINKAPAFMAALRGPQHTIVLANEGCYRLTNRRDIIGKTVREALPEVLAQGFIELLDNVYRTGEPYFGNEVPLVLGSEAGGDTRFVNFVYQAQRGAGGVVTGVLVHGVDVTGQVLARDVVRQAALDAHAAAEANAKYRTFFDQGMYFAGVLSLDGTVVEANRLSLEACGFTRQQVIGKKFWECGWWNPSRALADIVRRGCEHAALGRLFRREMSYFVADGSERFVDLIIAPVTDETGRVLFVAPTGIDITEKKRLADERERLLEAERWARSEADRTSRIKDEFLATLSHELRTPLNAILGWSQILANGTNDQADLTEGLQTIERNARAQTQIIEDLLDMSRIISGKVCMDMQKIDLSHVISAAINTVKPTAEAKGVRIQFISDQMAGPLSGDANRLQQVFWNLLSNAVKFTPRGGCVAVSSKVADSNIEISVADTGEGISPDFLPFVFDRFRQSDSTPTRRHGGLGLGLAIAKQLVELHGGSIRAHSAGAGRGSTFRICLPISAVHMPAASPAESRQSPAAAMRGASRTRCDIEGVKVLVVDDESDARALLKRLLEDCKAKVMLAASAAEAFEHVKESRPDVLVSDIGMPGEDGLTLIRRIRALRPEQGGGVPAVALTAFARSEDRMQAMMAGFQHHVAKPVEPAELITMVASLTGRGG